MAGQKLADAALKIQAGFRGAKVRKSNKAKKEEAELNEKLGNLNTNQISLIAHYTFDIIIPASISGNYAPSLRRPHARVYAPGVGLGMHSRGQAFTRTSVFLPLFDFPKVCARSLPSLGFYFPLLQPSTESPPSALLLYISLSSLVKSNLTHFLRGA
ncbi:hypothetical protein C7M84_010840 [Penaeus vannamei]|uniref:Uncharacterized protein n=1 Tax=Penaeus vannamei TaxID=6689 RepID=A0A3R7NZ43_PENVA|nr:hypothetical protein C7M84_010840 [Penaeus vannamei]